jgi:hypothetical protein
MLNSDTLLLVAVLAWCFLVALLGTSIGIVLGTIRLPVLLLLASSPAAGAGANVGVSAVAAAAASIAHVDAGRLTEPAAAHTPAMTPCSVDRLSPPRPGVSRPREGTDLPQSVLDGSPSRCLCA